MCKDANSDVLKESLLKMIYHDAESVPEYIYIDNGKDYTAKNMTGYDRGQALMMPQWDFTSQSAFRTITELCLITLGRKDRSSDSSVLCARDFPNGLQAIPEH